MATVWLHNPNFNHFWLILQRYRRTDRWW